MLDTKVFTIIATVIVLWTTTDIVQGKYIYHSEINRWVKQGKVVATWEQAKLHCESEGAVLASPINDELAQYMTALLDLDHHETPYFIGIKLIQNTEVFMSIEGTLLDDLPEAIINKIDKLDPREGDCLGMSRSDIHVVPCWARLPYLCYLNTTTDSPIYEPRTSPRPVAEPHQLTSRWPRWFQHRTSTESSIDASTNDSTVGPTNCGFGYKRYSLGSCYKVHDECRSWHEAKSICSDEGGHLAIINDANEAKFLKSITFGDNYEYKRRWIGLSERGDGWHSVHGDRVDQIFHVWSYTVSGFPCGVLKNDGLLDDQSCNFKYGFICEISTQKSSTMDTYEYTPRASPSPDPYTRPTTTGTVCGSGYEFNYELGSCYKVHDEYKSWDEANSTCSDEGGYLAVINDANEAEYLKSITTRPYDEYKRKWIGLRKIDGDWRSVHGDRVEQIFNKWSKSASGRACGSFKSNGLLDDQSCTFKYRFICEKSMQDSSTPDTHEYTPQYKPSSTPLPRMVSRTTPMENYDYNYDN